MTRTMFTTIAAAAALAATGAFAQTDDASKGAGNVTAAEAVGGGTMPTYSDMDKNADGMVDETEFKDAHGEWTASRGADADRAEDDATQMWTDMDADADGSITEAEYDDYSASRGAENPKAEDAAK